MEAAFGPLLVHDRAGLERKAALEPGGNASEWIEDHVAMAMKWGAPVLAATRSEWLPASWPDGAIAQLPQDAARFLALDGPTLAVGRADHLGPGILAGQGPASKIVMSPVYVLLPERVVRLLPSW
jgi:hypothetical protein